ncbi:MAG TPA: NYN domain protein, partial [Paraburkholderia sp.]
GFRAFGNLLEEAQARGLLEFGRDEKSGAYVYRSAAANVGNDAVNEPGETEVAEHAVERADDAQDAQVATAESAGKHKSRRKERGNRKTGRDHHEAAHHEPSDERAAAIEPPADEETGHTGHTRHVERHRQGGTQEPIPSASGLPADQPDAASVATAQSIAAAPIVADNNSEPEADREQSQQTPNVKKRASRKTAAKKAKNSTPRTIDELSEIAAPAEPSASHISSRDEAPAPSSKATRKTASRGRRPRKTASTDNAE